MCALLSVFFQIVVKYLGAHLYIHCSIWYYVNVADFWLRRCQAQAKERLWLFRCNVLFRCFIVYLISWPALRGWAQWVLAMVTTTAREENGEFCVAVAPATRTAYIYWPSWLKALPVKLSQLSGRSWSYTGLIGFNPRRLKALKGDELPRNGPSVYAKSSSSLLSDSCIMHMRISLNLSGSSRLQSSIIFGSRN